MLLRSFEKKVIGLCLPMQSFFPSAPFSNRYAIFLPGIFFSCLKKENSYVFIEFNRFPDSNDCMQRGGDLAAKAVTIIDMEGQFLSLRKEGEKEKSESKRK